MLIKVRNKLPGYLDLSPLRNHDGAPLVLRGKAEHELPESDLEHPVVLRVVRAGWLERVTDLAVIRLLPAPPAPAVETVVAAVIPEPASEPAPEPAQEPLRRGRRKMPQVRQAAPDEEIRMPDMPDEAPPAKLPEE